jgi:hypothetical protein
VRQLELFTPAQLATMRDRTRRRNYSAAAEEFRNAHQRHRAWGLTQRHNQKLSHLYGSTTNASAALRRRADELASRSAPTRTAQPTSSEPTSSEPTATEPVVAEPVTPEPVTPEPVAPEQVAPEQVVAKATESEPSGPLMPDRGHDAARGGDPSRPSRPGTTAPCPGQRHIRSRPPGRQHPTRQDPRRPGQRRGRATKGMRRPARHPHPEAHPEPAANHARRHPAPAGGKNADDRRRTRTHPAAASRPKGCREQVPP